MKQPTERNIIVLIEGKYVLSFDANNWIVSEQNQTEANHAENNRLVGVSYHPNIQQAIIALSNRMLKDSLSMACKNKVLELKELVEIVRTKDQWMRRTILGRCRE